MPVFFVTLLNGSEVAVDGESGTSLMENIRAAGIEDLRAICGGSLSCGTCHVYVDPAFAARLDPMSEDESDLLETSAQRQPTSRLSCQIPFREDLAGIKVTIAPEG